MAQRGAGRQALGEVWFRLKPYLIVLGVLLPLAWYGYSKIGGGEAPATPVQEELGSRKELKLTAGPLWVDSEAVADSHHHAKYLVRLWASAVAADSKEIDGVEDVETAVALLLEGVKGDGAYADREIKVVEWFDGVQARQALYHLQWREESPQMYYEANPDVFGLAAAAPHNRVRKEAKAKLDAQKIAKVAGQALWTGSIALQNSTGLQNAIEMLVGDGVSGGPIGRHRDTVFKVSYMSEEEVVAAMRYLQWSPGGRIEFVNRP